MTRYLPAAFACAIALQAHSATFTVTLATDAGAKNSTTIPFGPGTPGDLRDAIFTALQTPGSNVIDLSALSGTIVLFAPLPPLFTTGGATLQIVGPAGGGLTIDGIGVHRPFFIVQGDVRISNLVIANGGARGGNGGNGGRSGGGGAGLGGGMLIDGTLGATSVVLTSVTFIGNEAIGGNGGSAQIFTAGAGGGGGAGGHGGDGASQNGGGGGFLGNGGSGFLGNVSGGGGGFSGAGGNGSNGAAIGGGGAGGFSGGMGGGNGAVGGNAAGGGGGSLGFPGASAGASAVGMDAGSGGFGGGSGGGSGANLGAAAGDYGGAGGAYSAAPSGFGGGAGGAVTPARAGFGGGGAGGFFGGSGSAGSNGGGRGGASSLSAESGGGGGGAGLGGALFVRAGTLLLVNTTFIDNIGTGGTGGSRFGGATAGSPGIGNGGAVFVNAGATGRYVGSAPAFSGNAATTNNDVAGILLAANPAATNATTNEDTVTSSGLVITRDAADIASTHFKIMGIANGALFQSDGVTAIANGDFITVAQASAGLSFMPGPNLSSPGSAFSFQAQASTSNADAGLVTGATVVATITVSPVADTPSVTNASTGVNAQTTSGLVISRNPADGAEVTHFKITGIQSGALFQNNGTTPIADGDFITFAQGNAGLKFTPAANSIAAGHFTVQASLGNASPGLGGATVTANITIGSPTATFTGPSATGTGNITASFTGGGTACGFSAQQFIPLAGNAASPPANSSPPGLTFPHGLFSFTTTGCTPGSVINFTITYPQPLPPGTQYWKYGPTAGNVSPHWYVLPAVIAGSTATFSITDGGLGDDDLAANGTIVDQGGPGVGVGVSTQVPTLSEWSMALLALLILGTATCSSRLRRSGRQPW